jgi:hypothetical protein
MAKLASVSPAGTVTCEGTNKLAFELATETTVPNGPALPFNVTVHFPPAPPRMVVGSTVSWEIEAGRMVMVALCELLFADTIIVATVDSFTATVFTPKTTVELPP